MTTYGRELSWPSGWSRHARPPLSRAGIVGAVGGVVVLVVAGLALGSSMAETDLWSPFLSGPWVGLALVGLVALGAGALLMPRRTDVRERATTVPGPAGRPERALVFEHADGGSLWLGLLASGFLGLVLSWTLAPGLPRDLGLAVVVVALGAGPLLAGLGRLARLVRPREPERVELTESRLVWRRPRRVVAVPWEQVTGVDARERALRTQRGTTWVPYLAVEVVAPTAVAEQRRGRARTYPGGRVERSLATDLAVPVAGIMVSPTRLYWGAVAFRDATRRAALLDGADITPPPPP